LSDFVNSPGSQVVNYFAGIANNPQVERLAMRTPYVRNVYPFVKFLGKATPVVTAGTRVADTAFSVAYSGPNRETGVLDPVAPIALDALARSIGSGTGQLVGRRIASARTAGTLRTWPSDLQSFLTGMQKGYFNNPVAKVITPKVAVSGIATDALVTGAMNLKGQDITQITGFQSDEDKSNLRLAVGGNDQMFKKNTYDIQNADWFNRLLMGNGYETQQVPNLNTGIAPKVDFRTSGFGNDKKALRPYISTDDQMRKAGLVK
jgi:hypothetical protein